MNFEPINQTKLFGINDILHKLINLYEEDRLPNKILLSGQKSIGKFTLALHLINYVLSKNEDLPYDKKNCLINPNNRSYKLTLNKSNPNLFLVEADSEKKNIDINQIRDLIVKLNKSSFNNKPRFVLIDNIEYLNINSINALLKILEEPNDNIVFILINNNKKVLPTLLSRCINFKISLEKIKVLEVVKNVIKNEPYDFISDDLINYYSSPGDIIKLIQFANLNKYDFSIMSLKEFLNLMIDEKHYKKDSIIKYLIFDFIEYYLTKFYSILSSNKFKKYDYFIKKISLIKNYHLDDESVFIEFKEDILNG